MIALNNSSYRHIFDEKICKKLFFVAEGNHNYLTYNILIVSERHLQKNIGQHEVSIQTCALKLVNSNFHIITWSLLSIVVSKLDSERGSLSRPVDFHYSKNY